MITLFDSKKSKTAKSHLKNLIALAKLDGQITTNEYDLINKVGETQGLKESEISQLIEDADLVELEIPTNDLDRFDQIYDLIHMMTVDGVIDDSEMDFCIEMAEKLGFRKAIVGVLVRKIALNIDMGVDKEVSKSEAEAFLQF